MIDFEKFYHNPKLRAIAFIVFGIAIFINGFIFYTNNWDDLMYGLITGPIVIIIAIICLIRAAKKE